MSFPSREREELLKEGWGSAVASMRHRPRVSRGIREERYNLACRAASLVDDLHASGGGEGRCWNEVGDMLLLLLSSGV